METWPASLQDFINEEGFQVQIGNTTVRSDVDVGLAKVRSRFTDGIDVYTTTIYVDYDDVPDVLTFYKTTLVNGTLTFGYDDPLTGVSSEFRFAEPPDIRPRGGRNFTVSMKWEKIP